MRSMRSAQESLGHGQFRLLTVLLIILIIRVTAVNGAPNIVPVELNKIRNISITGGDPLKYNYQLINQCSHRHVQMKPGRKRGRVNAVGHPNSNYTHLTFMSNSDGTIYIRGAELNRYLCFNRKGKLVLKWDHREQKRCKFVEEMSRSDYKFRSAEKSDWYVGFRRNGKPFKGFRARSTRKQMCFTFMKKRLNSPNNSPFELGFNWRERLWKLGAGR